MPTQNQMHAWRKHKSTPIPEYTLLPIPPCPSNGYLIRLLASGVCHSDETLLQLPSTSYPTHFHDPYTLGHEGCGTIASIGADLISSSEHQIGERVALLAVPGCGDIDVCPECHPSRDLPQLCLRGVHHGLGQDGFFAGYVAVSPRSVVRVPQNVSDPVAAVATDAVLTAYHGVVKRARVGKGEIVFLFGLGGLGMNALQLLVGWVRVRRVLVSDLRRECCAEAVRLGVDPEDVVPDGVGVREWLGQKGLEGQVDVVLDFVGSEQTIGDAQHVVRIGGRILCVGLLDAQTSLNMRLAMKKRLTLLFTYGGQRQDLVECLDLIAKGVIKPQVETARIEDFPTVLKDLCDGKIKSRMALLHSKDELE